jgi:hypothetical protein
VHGRRRESHRERQVWSSTLTASLLEQGLVDEIRVMVKPVLLGGGKSGSEVATAYASWDANSAPGA